jgi:hypothetical protein
VFISAANSCLLDPVASTFPATPSGPLDTAQTTSIQISEDFHNEIKPIYRPPIYVTSPADPIQIYPSGPFCELQLQLPFMLIAAVSIVLQKVLLLLQLEAQQHYCFRIKFTDPYSFYYPITLLLLPWITVNSAFLFSFILC